MFIKLSLDGLGMSCPGKSTNVGAWPLGDLHVSYPALRPPSHHPLSRLFCLCLDDLT